jgi:hypothetical protein
LDTGLPSTTFLLNGATTASWIFNGTGLTNLRARLNPVIAGTGTATLKFQAGSLGTESIVSALISDGTNGPVGVTAGNALKVDGSATTQPVSGTITANAGSGTFTVGGTVTSNQGTPAATANRWPVQITDGTNLGTVKPASTSPALADTAQVMNLSPNPSPVCTTVQAISQTASAQVITGTAAQFLYICAIHFFSATAQNISIVEGTGTVCATGIAALYGATTADMPVAANGGMAPTAGLPYMKTKTAADNLCILQSGTGKISGMISYVSRP